MGVERAGSGMVDADGCHDTYGPTVFMQNLRNGPHRMTFSVQTQSVVGGLLPRSQTGSRCRRVGNPVAGTERAELTGIREHGHTELLATNFTLQFGQIHLSSKHLIRAHAVAYHIEHILCLRGSCHHAQCRHNHYKKAFHICLFCFILVSASGLLS